ncbi:MAG: electron transport complex subunit RsxC [Oscillospiraceae bacterium]|nr:electron transport complex subunit RsxC [Oscillospiraceae bacterium]
MAVFKKLIRSAEGAHVPHNKNTENSETVKMPAPKRVYVSMSQHIGAPAKACVKKGDVVSLGDVIGTAGGYISANIHSPVSGKVFAVDELMLPNGSRTQTIVIDNDGLDTVSDKIAPPTVTDHASFVQAIKDSGLVGLGGAGFPSGVKLEPKNLDEVDTLVINAAECEPYITADYREMMECGEDVIAGAKAVKEYLNLSKVIIGIEANKPRAIKHMQELCAGLEGFSVFTLPSVYPQGAEKILIETTTGKEVPQGGLPRAVGVIVMNVASCGFVGRYLRDGMPLISKRVTIDGDAVTTPQNVEVRIGTPVKDIIEFCGGYSKDAGKIISGGPMMGMALADDSMPVLKQNNAFLVFGTEQAKLMEPSPCIRCGRCINACPMGLAPVEIANALTVKDADELKALFVDLCMECGSCSFVCPAKRPVAQTMKEAKDFLRKAAK